MLSAHIWIHRLSRPVLIHALLYQNITVYLTVFCKLLLHYSLSSNSDAQINYKDDLLPNCWICLSISSPLFLVFCLISLGNLGLNLWMIFPQQLHQTWHCKIFKHWHKAVQPQGAFCWYFKVGKVNKRQQWLHTLLKLLMTTCISMRCQSTHQLLPKLNQNQGWSLTQPLLPGSCSLYAVTGETAQEGARCLQYLKSNFQRLSFLQQYVIFPMAWQSLEQYHSYIWFSFSFATLLKAFKNIFIIY